MNSIKQILFILVFFTFGSVYAHKDRVETPQSFIFTLKSKEIVRFKFTDLKLEEFCKEIVSKKKEILEAQLFYKTGEVVTIRSDGKYWNLFKVTFKGKSLYVPQDKLRKIPEIHFSTLFLFWPGGNNAFNSSYICFRVDIGTERSFDVLPNLELHFENFKFSKSEVWTQTSENSRHGKNI
jgi:hypothetical protein